MAIDEGEVSIPYTPMIMKTSEQRDTTTSHATTTVTLMTDNETPVQQDRWRKHIITIGPFLCDITVCVVIALLFTFVPLYAIRPYRRGFFCGDESIRYPYKHSTVTTRQVYLISLVMLSITIMATEIFRAINLPGSEPFAFRRNASWIVVRVLTYFAYCIFGLLLNLAFTQTTKWSVGRLRPHFLDVCKPNVTLTPCRYPYAYITDYVCQGAPEKLVDEARRSFFSGHAAQSMGTAIFCVIYMQARLPRRTYGLTIVPVFQSLHIGIALLIGLSRLSDNMHHWSDVFVGFLVGCATGYYSAVILAKVFEPTDESSRSKTTFDNTESRKSSLRPTYSADPPSAVVDQVADAPRVTTASGVQSSAENSTTSRQ